MQRKYSKFILTKPVELFGGIYKISELDQNIIKSHPFILPKGSIVFGIVKSGPYGDICHITINDKSKDLYVNYSMFVEEYLTQLNDNIKIDSSRYEVYSNGI